MPRTLPLLLSTRTVQDEAPSAAVRFASEAGYQGVEVWLEDLWSGGEQPEGVLEVARRLGLQLTCHAASYDVNPTSFNPGIRSESRHQIELSIETAARLEAPVVTIHPGRTSASTDDPSAFWGLLVETFAAAEERGRALGVRVAVEHMEAAKKYLVCRPADVRRLLSEVPGLGYTLDLAHVHQSGETALAYWEAAGPPAHVHLSDSGRKTHLAVGEGEADLQDGLRFLVGRGYEGAVCIEGSVRRGGRAIALRNRERAQALLALTGRPAAPRER